jgi:hypothetical protein
MILNDVEIFSNKKFSDLLKDIYDNSKKKDRQINLLISELKPLIKNTNDASMVVPMIKEYLEVGVKNDEHLVKLAAIVQRIVSNTGSSSDDSGFITDDEKQQLLKQLEEIEKNNLDLNNTQNDESSSR